jgi:hypothetical protein
MDSIWGATHLERSTVWADQIKEVLLDAMDAQQWITWMPWDEGGNTTKNISSVGQLSTVDVTEGVEIPASRPDTGQFTFSITDYIGNAVKYTDEFMKDNYLAPQIVNTTPDRMLRAIQETLETKVLSVVNSSTYGGQTANAANTINGVPHRFAGGNAGEIEIDDFFAAKMILKKANVPLTNLIAIVPPEVAFLAETDANWKLVNGSSSEARWGDMVETGLTSGMRFVRNIAGFDIYESNYLPTSSGDTSLNERDGTGSRNVSAGKTCQFFSAATPDVNPFLGAWHVMPTIESWRESKERTEYYQQVARFGLKLWRPESIVSVCSTVSVL